MSSHPKAQPKISEQSDSTVRMVLSETLPCKQSHTNGNCLFVSLAPRTCATVRFQPVSMTRSSRSVKSCLWSVGMLVLCMLMQTEDAVRYGFDRSPAYVSRHTCDSNHTFPAECKDVSASVLCTARVLELCRSRSFCVHKSLTDTSKLPFRVFKVMEKRKHSTLRPYD